MASDRSTAVERHAWQLADWLGWQEGLHASRIDLGLERVRTVAMRMRLLPPRATTLTLAGTNGKGSSAVLAAGIYRAAGYRTGCYTSPHLMRYNERVAIDGIEATDDELCAAFRAVEAVREDESLTYFEFGTLAALWLFRRAEVDVQVLEIGLGGRLDAVNIVDADCAIVTEIGLDHRDWLGPDRESIGREKGGVYRAGRPAVCVDPDPPASLLRAGQNSHFLRVGHEFDFRRMERGWSWRGCRHEYAGLPLPSLPGSMQVRNAAGVLAAVEALDAVRPVPRTAIETGLVSARLAGRLERRGDLLLDVGHNTEAVDVLVSYLEAQPTRPRALVLGMMRDKPVEAIARRLACVFDRVYAASLPPPRGLSGMELATRITGSGMRVQAFRDVPTALSAVRAVTTKGEAPIVVCGSFKTVAAAIPCVNLK